MRRGDGMVDMLDSKSGVLHGRTGSNPVRGTTLIIMKKAPLWGLLFWGIYG